MNIEAGRWAVNATAQPPKVCFPPLPAKLRAAGMDSARVVYDYVDYESDVSSQL